MESSRTEIARERRRQIQVRKSLEAGLAMSPRPQGMRPFYLAVGDYLAESMDRLHDQDQLIHDLLRERIEPAETEARNALATLETRQGRSRELMRDFTGAVSQLRSAGDTGLDAFEQAARAFVATFTSMLLPRKNPFFRHTDRLFGNEDWQRIAGVTEDSLKREREHFDSIRRLAPAGADPDGFTAEHMAG